MALVKGKSGMIPVTSLRWDAVFNMVKTVYKHYVFYSAIYEQSGQMVSTLFCFD